MSPLDPKILFTILGPLLLALGLLRALYSRRVVPQARTWLLLGALLSLVAGWLWAQ